MQSSDIPVRFGIPFGAAAGAPYIRQVPVGSQIGVQDGAASMTDGFPPDCFTPVAAGGTPPFGQDMNGLFNQITLWVRWQTAGAQAGYDSAFSAAIGGYPRGAMVAAAGAPGVWWVSSTENNVTDPDTGGAGWLQTAAPQGYYADTSPSASALVIAPAPAPVTYSSGLAYRVRALHTITGAATLDAGAGALAIQSSDGGALVAGDIIAGQTISVLFDVPANAWRMLSATASQLAGGGLVVDATAGAINVNIDGLALKGSPLLADEAMIWDTATSSYRKATLGSIAGLAAYSDASFLVAYFNALFGG